MGLIQLTFIIFMVYLLKEFIKEKNE